MTPTDTPNTLGSRLVFVRDNPKVTVGERVWAKDSKGVVQEVTIRNIICTTKKYRSCSFDYVLKG